jgi:hypothetical protein
MLENVVQGEVQLLYAYKKTSQVARRDIVFVHDWLLTCDYFIDAIIGMVGSFDLVKNGNRTIGSTSTRVVSVSS